MKAYVTWIAKRGETEKLFPDLKQPCIISFSKKKKEIIINKDTFHCDLFLPFPKEPNSKDYVSLTFKDSEKSLRKLRIHFPEKQNLKLFVTSINKMQRGETTWKEPEEEWVISLKNNVDLLPNINGLEHHTLFHIYVDSEIINLSGEIPKGPDEEIVRGKSAALVRRYYPGVSDCSMKSNIAMLKYIKKFRVETVKQEEEDSSGPDSNEEEFYRDHCESSISQNNTRLFGTNFSDSFSQPTLHDLVNQLTGLSNNTSLVNHLEAETSVRGSIHKPLTEMNSTLPLTQGIARDEENYVRNINCKTEIVPEVQDAALYSGMDVVEPARELQIQENNNVEPPVQNTYQERGDIPAEQSVCQPHDTTASVSALLVPEQIETVPSETVLKTWKTTKRCLPLPPLEGSSKRTCLENGFSTKGSEIPTENIIQENEPQDIKPELPDSCTKDDLPDSCIKDDFSDDEDWLSQGTFGGIITSNEVPREQKLLKLRVDAAVDNTFFMLYANPKRDEIAHDVGKKLRDGFLALAKEEGLDSLGRISSHGQGLELLPQDGFEARLKRMFALCDEFLTELPSYDYCRCCNTGEYVKADDFEQHISSSTHLKRLRNFTIPYEFKEKEPFRVTNCALWRAKGLLTGMEFPTTYANVMDLLKERPVCIETALDLICHLKSSSTVEGTSNDEEDDIMIIGYVQKNAKSLGELESRPGRPGVKKEESIDDSSDPSQLLDSGEASLRYINKY